MPAVIDVIEAAARAASLAENPITEFTFVVESFTEKFPLTHAQFEALWEFCARELQDKEDGFRRLSEVLCREHVLRAISDTTVRKFWRPVVQYENQWMCQLAFRNFFEYHKLSLTKAGDYVNAYQKLLDAALKALNPEVQRSVAALHAREPRAARILTESFDKVLIAFENTFSDAKECLKQYGY